MDYINNMNNIGNNDIDTIINSMNNFNMYDNLPPKNIMFQTIYVSSPSNVDWVNMIAHVNKFIRYLIIRFSWRNWTHQHTVNNNFIFTQENLYNLYLELYNHNVNNLRDELNDINIKRIIIAPIYTFPNVCVCGIFLLTDNINYHTASSLYMVDLYKNNYPANEINLFHNLCENSKILDKVGFSPIYIKDINDNVIITIYDVLKNTNGYFPHLFVNYIN